MKRSLKILKSTVSFLLTVFIIVTVAFVVQAQLTGGKAQVLDHEILTVLSGSMEPDIETGSVIAIETVDQARDYEVGDVITYHMPNDPETYVTHRVIDVQPNEGEIQYATQGDNNRTPDLELVEATQIIGHYNGMSVPYAGYVFDYVQSDQGIVLMLMVPGFLLLISSFIQVWKIVRDTEYQEVTAMGTDNETTG
ncbi:signal peptidase I [Salicibibacter cibi]|uniref:Signal peptidase I n=1 Tax=Salicibibacter cibi TaxID=2743001 RepID=A0A7T6ZDY4_9BACI|nr:signal peptidase I [Salicibibacter cibi]QQK81636.1 signal peptidase I [Salicibibacter cibi]